MYIEDIPTDVRNHIFSYCHIEDLFLFSQTAKNSQQIIVQDYFVNQDVTKLIKRRCKNRKKEKQLFFYHYILKVPDKLLSCSIGMARVFCYIDDEFHNTSFTLDVLKWTESLKDLQHEEWTYNHSKFYKYCLDEITNYYYNMY